MIRIAAWLGLALIVASPAAAQTTVERAAPFASNGALRIMVLEGSVRVRAWDRDSLRVVARLPAERRGAFYFGVSTGGEGGKLGVEGDGPADVDVRVPRGATVWVKTAGGAIEVAGVDGSVDVFSVTGGIRVEGGPRSLHAESMGGGVVVEGAPGTSRVRTGAGSIAIRGGGEDVTLYSVSGSIELDSHGPLRRGRVETVSGAVDLRTSLVTGSTLVVESHDGPVTLALPVGTAAEFVVATLEGTLRNSLSGGGARKTTGLRGRELSFTTGNGGADVTVRTFSGDVTVRPVQTPAVSRPSQ